MKGDVKIIAHMYDRFNARDIESVLKLLTDDVVWANGCVKKSGMIISLPETCPAALSV